MKLDEPKVRISRRLETRLKLLIAVGAATLVLGLVSSPQRVWPNLLLVSFYLLTVSLAGAVFVAMQYVTGAHWAVALRRVPEAMAKLIPLGGAGVLILLIAHPALYSWTSNATRERVPAFRHWWLSLQFFRGRAVVFLLLWTLFAVVLVRGSRRQDADGAAQHTRMNSRLSALFIVLFAFSFWLASYDWIMSLEPRWYSTIFASYNFAGLFLGGLAALTLLVVWLREKSALAVVISDDHLHDLGKLLFAFSTFWMYLWFSQYMLIWYANIPEETVYFVRRLQGYWGSLFVLDMVLNWVGPFFALLPRRNKHNPGALVKVCLVLLAGRWLDLYLMIMPSFAGKEPPIGAVEIGLVAGSFGLFVLAFFWVLRQAPLVPVKDPFLEDSLHYHA
jgi:hypothetical protein